MSGERRSLGEETMRVDARDVTGLGIVAAHGATAPELPDGSEDQYTYAPTVARPQVDLEKMQARRERARVSNTFQDRVYGALGFTEESGPALHYD